MPQAPLVEPVLAPTRAALAAAVLAFVMCWPILVTGDAFVFLDTAGYLSVGDQTLSILGNILGTQEGGTGAVDDLRDQGDQVSFVRSFAYSTFLSGAVALGGPLLAAFLQGWIAIFACLALAPARIWPWWMLAALPLAVTTLPWFTVFLMPDIFTAVIIVFGAVLWRAFDTLSPVHRVLLVGLAIGASLSHYGNPPLAFGLYALVLAGRLVQRRLGWQVVLATALPVLMGPLVNLGASAVVLDSPSMAPKRLPILLARSIQDGPAAWYLSEACAGGTDLAICAAFDGEVPDDMTVFLWSDRGIKSLDEDQMAAIRAEESRILMAAFRHYPLEQTASFTRNAVRQAYSVGLNKIDPVSELSQPPREDAGAPSLRLLDAFDGIVDWTTLAGAFLLIVLALRAPHRIAPVLFIFAGLLLNALIFGGLSAPDDRYQARVAWLLPALALIYATADAIRPSGRP